ncbi:uncharacterized protein PITG_18726 [Phytophthora infestans T30-4]|uniref:Endonuclease/exonuclease/phosphatase domain-containing protein n=1 Tax=Phytophthora infestans (strain T30-4) TaxID=403677 RepID=D0NZ37_PHYIT|nr:uncharacterized protein PITG_18726 [Phytophthora infestans T30-4]EEY68825.1 conserved hypothetical protein [Phytophthora infestans T30-4]|eukprot:XP_002997375.1 conserved hypothetical protein [Phytophthora infestans T30-4]
MSFNVLADYLVINDRVNEPAKRHQKYDTRLMREISRWSPHIVNLQEVDHFEDFFEPKMKNAGFVGVYKRRTGEKTHDGCAIFVRKSMFRIVSSHPIEYHVPDHPVLDRDNIALTAVWETRAAKQLESTKMIELVTTEMVLHLASLSVTELNEVIFAFTNSTRSTLMR